MFPSTVLLFTKKELKNATGLSRSTFYYRLGKLPIAPDSNGFYYESDLELFKSLDQFLKQNPRASIEYFLKIRENNNAWNQEWKSNQHQR